MKKRKINKINYAVSNVLGYLLTFSIISLLMVAAVLTTNSIVDSKNISAGEQIAQSLANQIADSLVDIVSLSQSMPSSSFDHSVEIPVSLAGRRYYIEIAQEKIFVNSTDGKISRSCTTFNHHHSIIGFHQKIFSDTNKIMFSYTPSPLLYTLDFSKGNSFSHSPVESGSYMITPIIDPEWPEQYQTHRYRTPFIIDNTDEHANDIIDATISVALDSKSIDYSKTHVQFIDKSDTEIFGSFSEPYAYSDLVFLLYEPSGWTMLEYSIDYWNEQGNSLISLRIPQLLKDETMYVFVYYGSDPLIQRKVSLDNTSEFFYDFSDALDLNVWTESDDGLPLTDSYITLSKDQYILSKEYSIPNSGVESLYVIESKQHVSNGDGSVIAFSNSNTEYSSSYLISYDKSDSDNFFIHKQNGTGSEPSHQLELNKTSVSAASSWVRQKTFLYVNTTSSITNITSYIYDFNTYAFIPNFIHASDEVFGGVSSYDTGYIGFGSGLLFEKNDDAELSVDWVRVTKIHHGFQPNIRWGAWETTNCRWNTSSISAAVHNTDIQLQYGPLLSDYHFNGIELRQDSPFTPEDEEQDEDDEEQDDTELSGSGTVDDPYQIYNWHHLNMVRNHLNSHFVLMNDLDSTTAGYIIWASPSADDGLGWMPIGNNINRYSGIFNGQNYTISDLYIDRSGTDFVGLFGYTYGANIVNVGLVNVYVTAKAQTGGLIGRKRGGGIVFNCYVIGEVTGNRFVGGLIGIEDDGGSVFNCYFIGEVTGVDYVGGLIGRKWGGGFVSNCYTVGPVKGGINSHFSYVGGLIGQQYLGSVLNCSATGEVTSSGNNIGGLIGDVHEGIVSNSSATGNVAGSGWVGGLIGNINRGSVSNCYATGDVTGDVTGTSNSVGGLIGRQFSDSSVSNSYATGDVTGRRNVGGLIGLTNGSILNCYAIGHVKGTGWNVGGLIGNINRGSVSNCYATGDVVGTNYVGGLVGYQTAGNVSNSSATGNVTGTIFHVGGLIGFQHVGSRVSNSYATGDVTGEGRAGGLIGTQNVGSIVSSSYSTGSVIRSSGSNIQFGGFVGVNERGKIFNSYSTGVVYSSPGVIWNVDGKKDKGFAGSVWIASGYEMNGNFWDIQTSGQSSTAGDATAKTTDEMKALSTFITSGWDIAKIEDWNGETWYIDDGVDYPRLGWTLYAGGDGSLENPYQISNWYHLNNIRYNLDQSFVLINDIDRYSYRYDMYASSSANGGAGWRPIGTFRGIFDGRGKIIKDVYINRPSLRIGFFSTTSSSAKIMHVSFENFYLNYYYASGWYYNQNAGGLVGRNYATITNSSIIGYVKGGYQVGGLVGINYGKIINSYAIGDFVGYGNNIGGIAGMNYANGQITNSYVNANVTGSFVVGGLIGSNTGTIANSYVMGSVNGTTGYVGGLVGSNSGPISNSYTSCSVIGKSYTGGLLGSNHGKVINSYSSGDIHATSYVGGLVGDNRRNGEIINSYATGNVKATGSCCQGGLVGLNQGIVTNSYSSGAVEGTLSVGGLVGSNQRGDITSIVTNSFWDIETSGQASSAEGVGKTTAEMKTLFTFDNASWDIAIIDDWFTELWYINDGVDYPRLFWQKKSQPVVQTNNATHITETTAKLWGTLLDDSGEACAVGFNYGTTPSYGASSPLQMKNTGESFHYQITELSPGQLYYYQAIADNSEQQSTGENKIFLSRPAHPTHVSGQINNPTSITLQWIKGIGAHNTTIQRKTGSYPTSINDGVTVYMGTGTSFTDTELNPDTIYYYSLWSYTSCDTTLLYQYSLSYARIKTGEPTQADSAEFIIQNLPKDIYTIQITKGDHQNQNDAMTILCNFALETPVLTFSDCNPGSVQTKQFTINKNTDEDIKITFQRTNEFFTVYSIKIYIGAQTLMIKENGLP